MRHHVAPPKFILTIIATIILVGAYSIGKTVETLSDIAASDINWTFECSDQPIDDFRLNLLDQAFQTASSIPIDPHIKDRSRAQEKVVLACLELDLPQRAFEYAQQIEDWRRGLCFAELALYCAAQEQLEPMNYFTQLAIQISEETEDWRRDRLRVKIAQVYAWMGDTDTANEFEEGVIEAETSKVERILAIRLEDDHLDSLVESIQLTLQSTSIDVVQNSLQSLKLIYLRVIEDTDQEEQIAEMIRANWGKLLLFQRIQLIHDLVGGVLELGKLTLASDWLAEAQLLIDSAKWPIEYYTPILAKQVELRYRAGDRIQARADADAILVHYKEYRETVVDIWRAGALRPLAETYSAMGNVEESLAIFQLMIEEGMVNPNSRPRAEDLSSTCLSMALVAIEPTKEMWMRIRKIHQELDHPW